MSRILVLAPAVLWLLWSDVAEPARSGPAELSTLALFFGGMLLAVLLAAYVARRGARMDVPARRGAPPPLALLHRLALPAVLIWFGVGLFHLGWGDAVRAATSSADLPTLRLPGLVLATLPAYGAWALLLAAEYPLERRRRESRFLVDLDQGRALYPPSSAARYWWLTLRQRLLFALAPLLLLMLVRDAVILGLWSRGVPVTASTEVWLFVFSAMVIVAVSPELIRRLLPTRPLPRGPLRNRLEALCAAMRLPMSDILVWDTDGTTVNAAVVGFLPRLRYVLLSDLMLDSMTPVQIEAVFAHEAGHVRHRHLLWYFVFLTGMTLFFAGPVDAFWRGLAAQFPLIERAGAPVEYAIGLGSLAVILALFGTLSRCFERQADVFAARTMQAQGVDSRHSALAAPVTAPFGMHVGPAGAAAFGSSLKQAARLNHISLGRRPPARGPLAPAFWLADQLTHFLHGTIRSRIDYLNRLALHPHATARFDRSITAVKLVVLAVAVGSGTFLLWS